MIDDLRRQLREVDHALAALNDVIVVRREYIALLQRVGSCERELAGLHALMNAASRLQAQRWTGRYDNRPRYMSRSGAAGIVMLEADALCIHPACPELWVTGSPTASHLLAT